MNRNYEIKVGAFGRAMVTRFEANQDRGGWRTRDAVEILNYIDEAEERLKALRARVEEGRHPVGDTAQAQEDAILTDCADLANLALIVAENCNAIKYTPKETLDPHEKEVYYFGCMNDVGHYLYLARDGEYARYLVDDGRLPRPIALSVDGGFYGRGVPNGAALLHYYVGLDEDTWTILSFPDNSVDSRPGSHSTYIMTGKHGFDDAVLICRASFPRIWKRYKFEVKQIGA